jgi:hypothetical protein
VLIAVAALRFLYWVSMIRNWQFDEVIPAPKKPRKLPVVLNAEEQFLVCSIESTKHRAILTPCYAAGMYISEAVFLKIDDTDSQRMVIRVNQAKGQKDRYVMLSPHAEDPAHMVASEEAPPLDLSRRLPRFLGLDAHGETNAITVAEPDAVGRNWKADQDLGIQRSGKDLPARFTPVGDGRNHAHAGATGIDPQCPCSPSRDLPCRVSVVVSWMLSSLDQ